MQYIGRVFILVAEATHFLKALEGYGPEVLEEFADEVDLQADEWIDRYIF